MKKILFFLLMWFFLDNVQAQTKLYFSATESPAVTRSFDAAWNYTSEAVSRKLTDTKGTTAITTGTQIGPWTAGNFALDRQYISTRMDAGITFTSGAGSFDVQLMVREYATADNVDNIIVSLRIISEDGSTVRATLRAATDNFQNLEFINNATHRNQTFSGGGGVTYGSTYTTVSGDRLCVEIGFSDNSGSSPEASAKWGENATDLPVNNTQTTDGAGWIQFSNTITFIGEPAGATPVRHMLPLTGVGTIAMNTRFKNHFIK